VSTLTRAQREQLIEALARTLCWDAAGMDMRSTYRSKAVRMADEMIRSANAGNAIQIRRAIEKVVEQESVA
jgi:hypothetical protein